MIREHGPESATARLCLYTVNAFLDDDGFGWPSQKAIAKAACLVEKTAQKFVAQAIDQGWLAAAATHGRKWKLYQYRASVPDDLANCETMKEAKITRLVDTFIAKNGPIEESDRPFKRAPKEEPNPLDVPVLKSVVPVLNPGRTHFKRGVVPVLKSVVPVQDGTKFPSEVPIEVSNMKFPMEGAVASDRTAPAEILDRKPSETQEERIRRIRKAAASCPDFGDADLAKASGTTLEEVRRVRANHG
jgi:hypothetical protein